MQHFVHYDGVDIPLLFGIGALEYVEDQLGGADVYRENLRTGKDVLKTLDVLFVAMAKCYRESKGLDTDIPDEWRHWLFADNILHNGEQFAANRESLVQAISDGYRSKHQTKEEEEDPFLAEARRERSRKKKANGGMTAREMIAAAMICGFTYKEARTITPGLMIDCYIARMQYDAKFSIGSLFGGKKRGGAKRG